MKFTYYGRLLFFLALALLFAMSCKHKEIQVAGHVKGKPKKSSKSKTAVAKKSTAPVPANTSENPLHQKLGLSNNQIKDSRLYSFIDEWYGVPYKYGGCLKTGVDCSCFTNMLCEKVYNEKISRSAGDMYNACKKIELQDAREGDLLFFKISSNTISHVGVYLRSNLFVHSSTSKGVIINSMEEAYYKKYFFCAGRVKNPS